MWKIPHVWLLAGVSLALFCAGQARGEVPAVLHHQGRVLVDGRVYEGTGWFKFAFVNAEGTETYWRNAPDLDPADGQPDEAVSLTLTRGLYSVVLGDVSVPHMAAIPETVFQHAAVYLRVWFAEEGGSFQRLEPDQRVTAVGYALVAATVEDGAITAAKLAPDALGALPSDVADLQQQVTALQAQVDALYPSGITAVSTDPADARLTGAGFARFTRVEAPPWRDGTAVDAPSPRTGETAVWTGDELLVWGGEVASGQPVNTGAGYRPDPEGWQTISPLGAPSARSRHTAVWTGEEMLVWGGFGASGFLADGGRFAPATAQWHSLAAAPLSGRMGHGAVWTGQTMLIWGGRNGSGLLNDGAVYDPATDNWTLLPIGPTPRYGAAVVWAGDRVIVWGGMGAWGPTGSGAELRFDAAGVPQGWQAMSSADAPSPRAGHTAVWTGSRLIVWGGRDAFGVPLNDGAAYDPATGAWTPLPGGPPARADQAGVWTGTEMLMVGGRDAAGPVASGYAYDPATERWWPLSGAGGPLPRQHPAAVWTGTELLVEGGTDAAGRPVGTVQRLTPAPTWFFYRKL